MRHLGIIAISAAILSFGLTMSVAPQPAEAGKACKRLRLSSPCVARSDIKPNAVNGSKVANGSLTGADVANGSLAAVDIRNEGGADFVNFGSKSIGTQTPETVVSVTVTTPSSGVVIVNASGTFSFTSGEISVICEPIVQDAVADAP
jgi:hypothetical protein